MSALCLINLPSFVDPLRSVGVQVIGGGTLIESAAAIRQWRDSGNAVTLVVADVPEPGLAHWIEANPPAALAVLRSGPTRHLEIPGAVDAPLPSTLNQVFSLIGWPDVPVPVGEATIGIDFLLGAPSSTPIQPVQPAEPVVTTAERPAPYLDPQPAVQPVQPEVVPEAPIAERPERTERPEQAGVIEPSDPTDDAVFVDPFEQANTYAQSDDDDDLEEFGAPTGPAPTDPGPAPWDQPGSLQSAETVQTAPTAQPPASPWDQPAIQPMPDPAPATSPATSPALVGPSPWDQAAPQPVTQPVHPTPTPVFEQPIPPQPTPQPTPPVITQAPPPVQPSAVPEQRWNEPIAEFTPPPPPNPYPPEWSGTPQAQTLPPPPTQSQAQPPEFTPPDPVGAVFGQSPAPVAGSRIGGLAPVIVSLAGKGGVGKSSLALLLGQRAAVHGSMRVVVIDANRGQGDLLAYLRLGTAVREGRLATIYTSAMSGNPSDAILTPTQINAARHPRLAPIKFGIVFAPTEDYADPTVVTTQVYRSVIEAARRIADLVIVDTQIVEAADTSGLIDGLVVPMLVHDAWALATSDLSTASVENIFRRLNTFAELGVPKDRMLLMFNRVNHASTYDESAMENAFRDVSTYLGAVMADESLAASMNVGSLDHDNAVVAPVLDAVLLRVTGNPSFAGGHGSGAQWSDGDAKPGLFGRILGKFGK